MIRLTLVLAGAALAAMLSAASAASPSAGGGSLATKPPPAQCSMDGIKYLVAVTQMGATTKDPNAAKRKVKRYFSKISAGPKGAGDSHHCCDADGSCSGPVDALTVCPVIKVWCRQENNQCICD